MAHFRLHPSLHQILVEVQPQYGLTNCCQTSSVSLAYLLNDLVVEHISVICWEPLKQCTAERCVP